MTTTTIDFRHAFEKPHAYVQVPGGRLAHWRFGSGPSIVAVHGWPLHSATFRTILPYLVDHFTVHLFDQPGTGRTEWNGSIGFESNAAALSRAIDAVGLEQVALLAHDSGGVTARLVAATDRRVRGLVLIGSEIPGHHSALLRMYLWATRVPGGARLLGAMVQIGAFRRSGIAFGTCFENAAYADGDFADLFVRPLARDEVRRGQTGLMRAFSFDHVDDLERVHGRITAPTLCVWGERDPFFPVEKARAMLPQFAGGAELVVVPGAKLFVHEDHPREVAIPSRTFLSKCLGGRVASQAIQATA
jgi:pimeloyl-ACP methyl ester carboxylesterase